MRRRLGLSAAVAAALVAALPPAAPAQGPAQVRYWPLREISYPVQLDGLKALKPAPTKLRFYVARDRGRFDMAVEKGLNDLDVINPDSGSRGFRYVSPGDGEYEFALMAVYSDGDTNPRVDELQAQYRVVIDTRPPDVQVRATGAEVEWQVQDDFLKADGVQVEVRWAGQSKWTAVTPRAFHPRDRYTWTGLKSGEQLEVRVVATDRAGHVTVSRPLTIPSSGAGGDAGFVRPTAGSGFGNPDEFPGLPQIEYVNTTGLTIRSKLTRVTRSGVKAAHLWVYDGAAGGWRKDKEQPVNITPTSPDTTVTIPYSVAKDGQYGFIVIPVNGAGGKQEDPRAGDRAHYLVEVDTKKPDVQVRNVKVSPGGAVGPKVEVEWQADDKNLWPEPIVLEYAEAQTGPWKEVHPGRLPNTGRYVWEVEDRSLWRFYVRVAAVDKASNRGEAVYSKQVIIDLETPRADIEKVQPAGGAAPQPYESERRPLDNPAPPPPAPARANSMPEPKGSAPTSPVPTAPTLPTPVPTAPVDSGVPSIPNLPSSGPIVPPIGK